MIFARQCRFLHLYSFFKKFLAFSALLRLTLPLVTLSFMLGALAGGLWALVGITLRVFYLPELSLPFVCVFPELDLSYCISFSHFYHCTVSLPFKYKYVHKI